MADNKGITYNKPNKYDYVTRKAFDRYCDLIDRRRIREVQDYRGDLATVQARVLLLEHQLEQLFPVEQLEQQQADHLEQESGIKLKLSWEERRSRHA